MNVAGVDSSTQSCKVLICDAATGEVVRSGRARHPDGTEVAPAAWWSALRDAADDAGGLADVDALSVGGQQHGMVVLDESGEVIRLALLWNDTRSAGAARDLIAELGDGDEVTGASAWALAVGSVPVASITATKLRWLRDAEPTNAARVASVCLPHDWLTWELSGRTAFITDRSDASGTGYWSPITEEYRPDLLERALGHGAQLPRVVAPFDEAGRTARGVALGPGAGDNAAAALGLGMSAGDVAISIGTSGVVSAVTTAPVVDPTGMITGFADATGAYLPLAATLNAAQVLDCTRRLLGMDYAEFDAAALAAPPGAGGVTFVPYLAGERTPNRPDATGALHHLTGANLTCENLARAAVEGLLCLLADALDAMRDAGVSVERAFLIGEGRRRRLCALAPAVLGVPVVVPGAGEYVARGAAWQAACVAAGHRLEPWPLPDATRFEADPTPVVRDQYAAARDLVVPR